MQKAVAEVYRLPVLLILAGIAAGIGAVQIAPHAEQQPWTSLLIWFLSIGLLLASAWRYPAIRLRAEELPLASWEWPAVLGLTIVAFLLRGVGLNDLPHNIHGDEGAMGLMARGILYGAPANPFATGWIDHPTFWFYLQSLALSFFGDSIGGLRMLSAILGSAAVLALYAFARPLWGPGRALLSAGLLAVYHFHIHFSRLGLNNIGDPLMALLVFAAFFYGYRSRTYFPFLLAGVLLGLAQYLYFGTRLLPLVLLVIILHQYLVDRPRLWAVRWHLAVLAVGFLAAFGPLLSYFLRYPERYASRLQGYGFFQSGRFAALLDEGLGFFQIMGHQMARSFGAFTAYNDIGLFYDPKMPLLDCFSALLFLLGLGVVLTRWRKPESMLLLAWLGGAALFGGAMMVDPPQTQRYVITAPVLCLLMVLALEPLNTLVRGVFRVSERTAAGAGVAIILLLGLWNVYFYFGIYSPRNSYGLALQVTELAYYLRQQGGDAYVYFFGAPYIYLDHPTLQFIAGPIVGEDVTEPLTTESNLPAGLAAHPPLLIFLPERQSELSIVQGQFPEGKLVRVREEGASAKILFLVYQPR